MRVNAVSFSNRKQGFTVDSDRGVFWFPYQKAAPNIQNRIKVLDAWVDEEIASEGFSFTYGKNTEETVHLEQVLEHCNDPQHIRRQLIYQLTIEAQNRLETSGFSLREVARRLHTSPTQLYRLLDQTNTDKTLDRLVEFLAVLGHMVSFQIGRRAGTESRADAGDETHEIGH